MKPLSGQASIKSEGPIAAHTDRQRCHHSGALAAAWAVLILFAAGGAVWMSVPFHRASAAAGDTSAPSLATVVDRSLASQTQVGATLGYAGDYTVVNQALGTITALPAEGQVIRPGHSLYQVDGSPILLMDGATPAYRTLSEGMSGPDVRELNADLVALGEAPGSQLDPGSSYFSYATAVALEKLQGAVGDPQTGSLGLGQAVFLPSTVRVTAVSALSGGPARPGAPVLQATSTRREVIAHLDATQRSEVGVGDRVMITLPNNEVTPGIVTGVGTVATTASSGASGGSTSGLGSSGSPTIGVDIEPVHPSATGGLDQAPVTVSITTAHVKSALVVPVDALLAQSNGGYAVEVVESTGVHHLVPVSLGLFDDGDGLVQVTGPGLSAGQHVVVPSI